MLSRLSPLYLVFQQGQRALQGAGFSPSLIPSSPPTSGRKAPLSFRSFSAMRKRPVEGEMAGRAAWICPCRRLYQGSTGRQAEAHLLIEIVRD